MVYLTSTVLHSMTKLYTKSSNIKLLVKEQARIKLNNLRLYQIFSKFSNLSKFLLFLPHYAAFVLFFVLSFTLTD